MTENNNRFLAFIIGISVAAVGVAIRLNVVGLSATREAGGTVYETGKQAAFSDIGLGLFVFGLVSLLLVFWSWLRDGRA